MKPRWPYKIPAVGDTKLLTGVVTQVAEGTFNMLAGKLSIADNMDATVVRVSCTHGIETPVRLSPQRSRPQWFQPLFADNGLQVSGTPQPLNYSRTDECVGITLYFAAPPHMLGVSKSANQTGIPHNTTTTVTWDVTDYTSGDFTYETTGVITCPVDGILEVCYDINGAANGVAAGDAWGGYIIHNSSAYRYGQQRIGVPTQSQPRISGTGRLQVAAGDAVQINIIQLNAAAANKDIAAATGTSNTHATLHYIAPLPASTATVTGILWGG